MTAAPGTDPRFDAPAAPLAPGPGAGIRIDDVSLTFRGDNDTHHIGLDAGQWRCTCHYFESWGSCVHLLTLQKVFGVMLPEDAQVSIFAAAEPVSA